MKKRIMCATIALTLALSLAACGGSNEGDGGNPNEQETSSQQDVNGSLADPGAEDGNSGGAVSTPDGDRDMIKVDNGSDDKNDDDGNADNEGNGEDSEPMTEESNPNSALNALEKEANAVNPNGVMGDYQSKPKDTPVDTPKQEYTQQGDEENSGLVGDRVEMTLGDDGRYYDQNGNHIPTGYDEGAQVSEEEEDDYELLIMQHFEECVRSGLHPYDNGFYIIAEDTGRRVTREEYDNWVAAGYDPVDDYYWDSEHEAGLY